MIGQESVICSLQNLQSPLRHQPVMVSLVGSSQTVVSINFSCDEPRSAYVPGVRELRGAKIGEVRRKSGRYSADLQLIRREINAAAFERLVLSKSGSEEGFENVVPKAQHRGIDGVSGQFPP